MVRHRIVVHDDSWECGPSMIQKDQTMKRVHLSETLAVVWDGKSLILNDMTQPSVTTISRGPALKLYRFLSEVFELKELRR